MSKRNAGSLRWRLVGWLLSVLVLAWSITLAVSYFDSRREVNRLLDAHLALSASLLVAQAGHEMDEIEVEHAPELERYGHQVAFQIWGRGNELILRSSKSPLQRLSPQEDGFSDSVADGQRWRVFSSWDTDHEVLIQVGEEAATREVIAASIGRNLLFPLTVAMPVLAVVVWFVIGGGLRSLAALGRQVALREPHNLTALDVARVPREVAPLVDSLNRLFDRVAASIEHERRFTADAAHELRTPIAALRTQAEVARGADNEADRSRALTQLIAASDRAARLIQQMLTLARTEPEQFAMESKLCDLTVSVRQVVAEMAPAALSQQVEIGMENSGRTWVSGDADLLQLLTRNLVDNAVRHGGGQVWVRVQGAPGGVVELNVEDQGPGVSAADRKRLGERFFRPSSSAQGSGLGLSIVLRIATLHGATVSFAVATVGQGLRVTVRFPADRP